jgi:hypothetical protein
VCAAGAVAGTYSTGVTVTQATQIPHNIFATSGTYNGNQGGLYFADYVCQTEATNAGLTGTWKAVLSDGSTNANARISLTKSVYNTRSIASGGAQIVATSAAFWSGTLSNPISYTASGGTPGTTLTWTGSTSAGVAVAAKVCSNWGSSSSGASGNYGNNTTINTNAFANGNSTCNNNYALYCINIQSSAAAPPDPTGFTNSVTSTSSIQFSWTSGGGTTAAYKLAYQAGASAPASCSTGTIVSASTLGLNPSTYTLTGLSASTQYSFRLCALNSDLTSSSAGSTLTVTTTSSGSQTNLGTRQIVFSTTSTTTGGFGGIYFADYVCQTEATNAGLNGTWKAIISNDTTSATSRISIPGAVYNNYPAASGGYQLVAADSTAFWASSFAYPLYYNAGSTNPGSGTNWTGSNANGTSVVGTTCSNWTTSSSGTNGRYGNSNTTGNLINSGSQTCNNSYSFYCTNQQSAAAAPPDPTSFIANTTATNYIQFSWASGGGTTAAYKLAYQTGASAPANCNSGTVISASTLGVNPTGYTVSGLSASTQYSFRLCAQNSDLSASSTGTTLTVTTTSSGTITNLGTR